MTEDQLAMLAWDVVRTVRDDFVGRRTEPTDADWQEAIAAALLKVNHEDPDETRELGYRNGYDDGFDDSAEGREHRFRLAAAA